MSTAAASAALSAAPVDTGGHALHPSILREYDIRGIVGETLHVADAHAIGRAFGTFVRQRMEQPSTPAQPRLTVCLAYDGRMSSPVLSDAAIRGLQDSGVDVVALGCGPTPMLYFAVRSLNAAGGIMITGSHNPPDHNGFKCMVGKEAMYGEQIRALGTIAASGAFATAEQGAGTVRQLDIRDAYTAALVGAYRGQRPIRAAWDAGNGAGGEIMARLCQQLPGEHFPLFEQIDGQFPNHHPDPTVEANLQDLIATVRREGCEVGLAFDGDADRVGVVDGEGNILWGDQLMVLYARDLLSRMPGSTIIADVKASQTLFDAIAAAGGTPLMWKTGHSLVKAKMAETGAPLAGEMSGHIFFADDYYGFDDGLYAAVRLLAILASSDRTLADLCRDLPATYATPEIRFACTDAQKASVIPALKAALTAEGVPFTDIDGIRTNTPDGWWLLRSSNTQNMFVARAEGTTPEGFARVHAHLRTALATCGITLPDASDTHH